MTKKLSELIGFDRQQGKFVLGTHDPNGQAVQASVPHAYDAEVSGLLAEALWSSDRDDHRAIAQVIIPPIEKVVPYAELYGMFFQSMNVGEIEDALIAIEDTVAIAWETHQDGAARYVRSGYSFTRPTYVTYDYGLEVAWWMARKAGWPYLERQMRRITEALAKKHDERALNVLRAALLPSHVVTVTGGLLTKAAINTVLTGASTAGFPIIRALAHPTVLMAMADFTWPVGVNLPDQRVEQLLTNLYLTNYGGIEWMVNVNAPIDRILFAGPASQVGWHITKGSVRNHSDVDMTNKRDLYLVEDQEHSWVVGFDATLWEIRITA